MYLYAKMTFLGQGFRRLELEQKRQTDRRDQNVLQRVHSHLVMNGVVWKLGTCKANTIYWIFMACSHRRRGRDKTVLSCLVANCVHTAYKTVLSCPRRRCEQAIISLLTTRQSPTYVRRIWVHAPNTPSADEPRCDATNWQCMIGERLHHWWVHLVRPTIIAPPCVAVPRRLSTLHNDYTVFFLQHYHGWRDSKLVRVGVDIHYA